MKRSRPNKLRRRARCYFAVALFLFPVKAWCADVSPPAVTQASKGLTLGEVVQIALENHSSVKAARYQIAAQDAVVHQQMSAYYPALNINNNYATGATPGSPKAFDTISSAANVSLTLYNFGRREGNVQSAKDTLDATRYGYDTTANNIVLAAKQAYYFVLQANALLRVNEETVKDREAVFRQTRGFYDVGTKPKSDVTQAEANLYIAQANLIVAQNSVETAWAGLRNAMGVDDLPKQPLAEELLLELFPMTLEAAQQAAFDARPELRQFDALLKAQDQLIAVARRSHLPELIFGANYRKSGTSNETGTTTMPDPANPGEEITITNRLNTFPLKTSWQVQLSLNIPIFNGFQTTYQVQQALSNYRTIKEQERVQRQQIVLQVEQSYLNQAAAREVVKANEAAVKAAKENLDLHEGRYQVGYASIVEVTAAQATYTTAQTNYVNSLVAYKLALAQLLNAIGAR
jgi:TolC family type I secretion outer membrane protein